jgi:RNA polymerase sigma-70 factor, ECF subfamily
MVMSGDSPGGRLDGGALFRAHAEFVARFLVRLGVRRQDLDDAVQEVFLAAHRAGGFTPGEAQPTTWLAEIALRIALALRRKLARAERGFALPCVEGPAEAPFEAAVAAQSLARVQRALEALSLEHRAVFVLYEIEGESCESIAAGLGIPVGTVHSRLHAARKGFQRAHERLEAQRPVPAGRGAPREAT